MKLWIFLAVVYIIYLLFFKKKKHKSGATYSPKPAQPSPKKWLAYSRKQEAIVQGDESEDDNLATFTLNNGQGVEVRITSVVYPKTSKKTGTIARWVQMGERIAVGDVEIFGGYFYFGQQMKSAGNNLSGYYDGGSEASLVDDTCEIKLTSYLYEDSSLGYWPSFSSLSPEARGAYVSWLASDRCDLKCPIGYVFIYLYGLERKALVDSCDKNLPDAEFQNLFNEICRLRSVFSTNSSFRGYSNRLLETMSILRPNMDLATALDSDSGFSNGMQFKLALAKTVHEGIPVSAELALNWLTNHAEYALRTPARRCAKEFAALFKRRYTLKYGEGMIIKANKTRLRLDYIPASPSLRGIQLPIPDLPDPSVLKSPVQKIMTLADICTDELNAYSRYLVRKGTSVNDTAAIMLLPSEIINESTEKILSSFKRWADEVIFSKEGLVSVADFWAHMNASCPTKINKKESDLMQAFALKMGYCLAPDPYYHGVKADVNGVLVLFPVGKNARFSPSPEFISAVLMLKLGTMVALIDNPLDQAEQKVLESAIHNTAGFTDDEKRSLHAYLTWQLHTPANMTGMKSRIELLGVAEKLTVGKVIVSVACSDGKITPAEIKQLEKIYSSLGLDPLSVSTTIHQYSTIEKTPVSSIASSQPIVEFALNANVLAQHELATDDVRKLLNTIFTEDKLELCESTPVSTTEEGGLDPAHDQLYRSLVKKEQWSRKEATELCGNLNLMLGGALEVINDWSYTMIDAPVLEDADNDIWVDLDIAKELGG